jgi:hypothetical protein
MLGKLVGGRSEEVGGGLSRVKLRLAQEGASRRQFCRREEGEVSL